MLCETCKAKPASIHITQIVGGQKKEMNLCASCAAKMGIAMGNTMFEPMEALLASLLEPAEQTSKTTKRCPACGSDITVFHNTGRLGCPQCYEVFSAELAPFIRKTQRGYSHTGTRPKDQQEPEIIEKDDHRQALAQAKEALTKAIKDEEYEQAAKLRDQIRTMEAKDQKAEAKGGGEDVGLA